MSDQQVIPNSPFNQKWRLVADRQNDVGFTLAKDTIHGMTLEEAVEGREVLTVEYASNGWRPVQTGLVMENDNGQRIFIYAEPEPN